MSQKSISIKWVLISLVIFAVVQAVLSFLLGIFSFLTFGIGAILFLVLKPLAYFFGGVVAGYLSPGVTIKEPAIAAVISVALGTILHLGDKGFFGILAAIISGIIAFAAASYGATIGEKMQHDRD